MKGPFAGDIDISNPTVSNFFSLPQRFYIFLTYEGPFRGVDINDQRQTGRLHRYF